MTIIEISTLAIRANNSFHQGLYSITVNKYNKQGITPKQINHNKNDVVNVRELSAKLVCNTLFNISTSK